MISVTSIRQNLLIVKTNPTYGPVFSVGLGVSHLGDCALIRTFCTYLSFSAVKCGCCIAVPSEVKTFHFGGKLDKTKGERGGKAAGCSKRRWNIPSYRQAQ